MDEHIYEQQEESYVQAKKKTSEETKLFDILISDYQSLEQ